MKNKRLMALLCLVLLFTIALQTTFAASSATGTVVWNANMTIRAWGDAWQHGNDSIFNAGIGGPDASMYTLTDAQNNLTCCGWKIRDANGTLLDSDGLIYLYYGYTFHKSDPYTRAETAYITVQTDLWHTSTVYSVR